MAELLLELLSEEIPARMQARAAEDLKRLVCQGLKDTGLEFDRAEAFATPRRLALVVDGLPKKQPDQKIERKGPRVDAPEKAIEGFLKSAGLDSLDQCEVRDVKGQEVYFTVSERKGEKTEDVIQTVLAVTIPDFPWPKSMRWGDRSFRWVRPLHSILVVFNGKALSFSLAHMEKSVPGVDALARIIRTGGLTVGHRFLGSKPFQVKDFADYKAKLKKAFVILDAAERCRVIEREAAKKAKAEGLTVRPDPALVAENAGLVEWPVVLMGRIEPEYMDLPSEVLTTVMRHHLKHFALLDKKGKLAPRFLVVAGTRARDKGKQIIAGNERVLRARLADAKFFWDQDRKRTLESRVRDLDGIVFHAKLGSLGEKVRRMETLAAEIAAALVTSKLEWTEAGDAAAQRAAKRASGIPTNAKLAARLAKADLTTEMVGEFPELQGVMGRYYALEEGRAAEIADAIADHYAPLGPNDRCPTALVSTAVALADKIDSLVGFFGIGQRPTGSKDPFALRRAALGVIRLILENDIRLSLRPFLGQANHLYAEASTGVTWDAQPSNVLAFITDRLKVHLKEKGVRHDLISAVFALSHEDDLVQLLARVEALDEFLHGDDGEHLLIAYKRAAKIVEIEEKKDEKKYDGGVNKDYLVQREEIELHHEIRKQRSNIKAALKKERYHDAMYMLATLRPKVDAFFDHVTVNCDDEDRRANRLRILSEIRSTLGGVADFSQIDPPSRSPLRRAKEGGGER